MTEGARRIRRTYLLLTLLSTLAASFIWGINTLFLLDAGLTNTEAFSANAFFTVGQVLFEVPTGVVADTWGRRTSYLCGAATLLVSTLLYLYMWQIQGPFWGWALSSMLIGLGFTFFSGAVEAWLVDALTFNEYSADLETVVARGQMVAGGSMLTGSVAGGFVAQLTNLGVPYMIRAAVLGLTLVAAWALMKDEGFTPAPKGNPLGEMRRIAAASVDVGWRNPWLRWVMLASPFTMGAGIYGFYALQPYLLELYGDSEAYGIAGAAAAVLASAQIAGGLTVPWVRRRFKRRTSVLIVGVVLGSVAMVGIGLTGNVWVAIGLLIVWSLMYAASTPVRQAYVNGCITSEQRATVLSMDSLLGSAGAAVSQPALGRVADVWGYGPSYLVTSAFQLLAAPFLYLARKANSPGDPIWSEPATEDVKS